MWVADKDVRSQGPVAKVPGVFSRVLKVPIGFPKDSKRVSGRISAGFPGGFPGVSKGVSEGFPWVSGGFRRFPSSRAASATLVFIE